VLRGEILQPGTAKLVLRRGILLIRMRKLVFRGEILQPGAAIWCSEKEFCGPEGKNWCSEEQFCRPEQQFGAQRGHSGFKTVFLNHPIKIVVRSHCTTQLNPDN